MFIQREGSKMILKDYNIVPLLIGLGFIAISILLLVTFMAKNVSNPLIQIFFYVFTGIFFLAGLIFILGARIVIITLDKFGKCKFSSRRLIGSEFSEFNIDDVSELVLEREYFEGRRGSSDSYAYTLIFKLRDGKEHSVYFSSAVDPADVTASKVMELRTIDPLIFTDEITRKGVQRVADFLGVPLTMKDLTESRIFIKPEDIKKN